MLGGFLGQEYNNCHDFRFKKAWNWLQKITRQSCICLHLVSQVQTWLHNIALQIEKKIYESYLNMIMQ